MQREVPFQPEAVLHELYGLEQIVSSIAGGSWAGGGGGLEGAPSARFSADDAAAGFHEWQEHSGEAACVRMEAAQVFRTLLCLLSALLAALTPSIHPPAHQPTNPTHPNLL